MKSVLLEDFVMQVNLLHDFSLLNLVLKLKDFALKDRICVYSGEICFNSFF